MTLHFIRPWILIGIPVVLLVWFLWRKFSDPMRGWKNVMDPELLAAMTEGSVSRWLGWSRLFAWLLAVVAIAGISFRPEPSPFSDDPAPVMILLKADESMLVEDVLPNRMERARLKAFDFSKLRNGRPTGLIAYAGSAHLVLPPTRDTDVVADMAGHLAPDIMPEPGNNLQAAINLAEKQLIKTGGSIVVMTDSVSTFEAKHPVAILAVSKNEIDGAILLTADSDDIEKLDRRTGGSLTAVNAEGQTRWAEAGYWLVPILGLIVLAQFRRDSE